MINNQLISKRTPEDDLNQLKIELRSRVNKIYSSIFLIEHKITDDYTTYDVHEYIDTIHRELDCIRDKIIH